MSAVAVFVLGNALFHRLIQFLDDINDSQFENPQLQYQNNGKLEQLVSCIKGHLYSYPKILEADNLEHIAIDTIVPTLWNSMVSVFDSFKFERELLKLEDNATVGLDYVISNGNKTGNNSVILLHHGLCGSSSSSYIHATIRKLQRAGYNNIVVFLARGCGFVPLTTPKSFNASRICDIEQVLCHINKKFPNQPIFACGYSLGGSILLNYVGSKGKDEKYLQGAVAISPAWNFHSTTPNFSYWSKYVLVNALKFYLWKNKNYFLSFPDNKLDVPALFKTQSVREFDYYAVELGGDHPSVDDYYYHSSPVHKSKNIFVPTLSINSINDPVCSIDGLPKLSDIGDGLCTVTVRKGGHVTLPVINQTSGSFLQYLCCISQSYGDELAIKWFDGILKNKSEVV